MSIPPVITALDRLEIYTTVPPWYSQLPSGVRSLYDEVGKSIESFLNNIPVPTPAGNVSVSATPSLTGTVTVPVASTSTGPPVVEATGGVGKIEAGIVGGVFAGIVGLMMM